MKFYVIIGLILSVKAGVGHDDGDSIGVPGVKMFYIKKTVTLRN